MRDAADRNNGGDSSSSSSGNAVACAAGRSCGYFVMTMATKNEQYRAQCTRYGTIVTTCTSRCDATPHNSCALRREPDGHGDLGESLSNKNLQKINCEEMCRILLSLMATSILTTHARARTRTNRDVHRLTTITATATTTAVTTNDTAMGVRQ